MRRDQNRGHFRVFKYISTWYVYWYPRRDSFRNPRRVALCATFLSGQSAHEYVRIINDAYARA